MGWTERSRPVSRSCRDVSMNTKTGYRSHDIQYTCTTVTSCTCTLSWPDGASLAEPEEFTDSIHHGASIYAILETTAVHLCILMSMIVLAVKRMQLLGALYLQCHECSCAFEDQVAGRPQEQCIWGSPQGLDSGFRKRIPSELRCLRQAQSRLPK